MPTNRQYLQQITRLESRFTPAIERIIRKFRKQFIASYRHDPSHARQALQRQMINEDILKVLRAIYRTAGLDGAKRQATELKKQATQKAGGFGRNEEWIARVIQYLRTNGLQMAANITDTMKEDIIKILSKAVDEGWGIDETVRQLQTRYVLPRAAVIARTEINRASNVGHTIAAQSLPYEVNKKWIAAKDERTRKSHRHVNGHVVDENGYFEVPLKGGGKEQMLFPGDPNGSAENVINCRCRVIYQPQRDSQGRLRLRNPNQAPVIPMRRPREIPLTGIAAVLKSQIKVGVE